MTFGVTLGDGTATISLPGAYWANEFDNDIISQGEEETVGGALVVEIFQSQYLRINLEFNEQTGWLSRATWKTIKTWSLVKGKQMTLTIDGIAYTVIFARPALVAHPLHNGTARDDAEYWIGSIKFITVA